MAVVFAEFASATYTLPDFTGLGLSSDFMYALLAVVVLSLLNILGVTLGKSVQNILTLAKVIGILGILVAGLGFAESNPLDWRFSPSIEALPADWRFSNATTVGWGALAMILVLYAYGGWNDAAFVAAEVRNPRRNIPLALLLGVGIVTLIYLLINIAYLRGLGFDGVRTPPGPNWVPVPARLLGNVFGTYGATAMNVIVMISALGAANGLTPRSAMTILCLPGSVTGAPATVHQYLRSLSRH
jgi:amino acid transporter